MYLADSNVLIEAKNRYYAFDIAPGFWVWLELAHAGSLVCSIEAVKDELLEKDDELADWAGHMSLSSAQSTKRPPGTLVICQPGLPPVISHRQP